jgi:hypothetical protein
MFLLLCAGWARVFHGSFAARTFALVLLNTAFHDYRVMSEKSFFVHLTQLGLALG